MGGWGGSPKEKIQSSVLKCTMMGAAFGSISLLLYHTSNPAKFFAVSVIDFEKTNNLLFCKQISVSVEICS